MSTDTAREFDLMAWQAMQRITHFINQNAGQHMCGPCAKTG